MDVQLGKLLYSDDTEEGIRRWLLNLTDASVEADLATLSEMTGLTIAYDTRIHVIQPVSG